MFGYEFGNLRAKQKKTAQQVVKDHFDLEVDEDTADAICIGFSGIQESKENRSAF